MNKKYGSRNLMPEDYYEDDEEDPEEEDEDEDSKITWIKNPGWDSFFEQSFGDDIDVSNIENIINNFLRHLDLPNKSRSSNEPVVWGFSIDVGPDKKPIIRKIGRLDGKNQQKGKKMLPKKQEPLVDIIETDDEITIIAEICGVKESDIKVTPSRRSLKILVDNPHMRYFNEIDFPSPVDPNSTFVRYQNGILEITVRKREFD